MVGSTVEGGGVMSVVVVSIVVSGLAVGCNVGSNSEKQIFHPLSDPLESDVQVILSPVERKVGNSSLECISLP